MLTTVNCMIMACSGVLGASKDTGHSLYTCGQQPKRHSVLHQGNLALQHRLEALLCARTS